MAPHTQNYLMSTHWMENHNAQLQSLSSVQVKSFSSDYKYKPRNSKPSLDPYGMAHMNSCAQYPLTVTQFTQEQCDTITSPILRSCMSQMGYNRNSAKEVVYGPVELGGFGFHDLFVDQGIHQVTALVGHLREKKSKTGIMMKIELAWCHLQAGTGDHLLENPCTQIDYIETCWIMSIRDFLRMYKVVWSLRNAVTQ
jgi:hypothetical protein